MTHSIRLDAVAADDLWRCIRAGDLRELERQLELVTRQTHSTSTRGTPLTVTETEKLLDEALWYVRARDLDEASDRLSRVRLSEVVDDDYDDFDDEDEEDEE